MFAFCAFDLCLFVCVCLFLCFNRVALTFDFMLCCDMLFDVCVARFRVFL